MHRKAPWRKSPAKRGRIWAAAVRRRCSLCILTGQWRDRRGRYFTRGMTPPTRAKMYSPNNHGPKRRIVVVVIIWEPKLPVGPRRGYKAFFGRSTLDLI